jgi:hypothetical protein
MHTSVYASPLPTVQNTPHTATKYSSTRSICAPTYVNEKCRLINVLDLPGVLRPTGNLRRSRPPK